MRAGAPKAPDAAGRRADDDGVDWAGRIASGSPDIQPVPLLEDPIVPNNIDERVALRREEQRFLRAQAQIAFAAQGIPKRPIARS
jgi:hypothetical protein